LLFARMYTRLIGSNCDEMICGSGLAAWKASRARRSAGFCRTISAFFKHLSTGVQGTGIRSFFRSTFCLRDSSPMSTRRVNRRPDSSRWSELSIILTRRASEGASTMPQVTCGNPRWRVGLAGRRGGLWRGVSFFSSRLPAGAHRSAEFLYIQYAALGRIRACARFQYHAVVKPNAL